MDISQQGRFPARILIAVLAVFISMSAFAGCANSQLKAETYSVTYNGNGLSGGAVPSDANLYQNGQTVAVLANTGSLVKGGTHFIGWNSSPDGTGTERTTGSTFPMGSANVTLFARWYTGPESIPMVTVPGGRFQMGSPTGTIDSDDRERPVHAVTVSGFRMGAFEVTQAQFLAATGENPSDYADEADSPVRPVANVTWFDAVEYCNYLSLRDGFDPVYAITDRAPASGYQISSATVTRSMWKNGYRLPTEAEWEYAARGGNGSPGNFVYSGSNDADAVDWYYTVESTSTHPVGLKASNGLGLYDMSGNVAEWCQDWYGDYGSAAQYDPQGPSSGDNRAMRGGSWYQPLSTSRSANREWYTPGHSYMTIGFRVVRRP